MMAHVLRKHSRILQNLLQPFRHYYVGKKGKRNMPRKEYMGPAPMIHKEDPNLLTRDFDSSLTDPIENGCIKQFVNRNPRSGELLGTTEKPKGYQTRPWRIDYYHR